MADSRSSFAWPMKLMAPKRTRAMQALYGFCREVDDIADGDLPEAEKVRQLEAWRARIDAGDIPSQLKDYMLPSAAFHAVIDAMLMDARNEMVWPSEATLAHYCDGAAGAVGLLAIRIFGASQKSEAFALALGQILQRINILRDIEEDARRGRIYLPREAWGGAQTLPTAAQLLAQPSLIDGALLLFRSDIDARLKALSAPRQDRMALLPAYAMLGVYKQLYQQLPQRKALSLWAQCKGLGYGMVKMVVGVGFEPT